MNLPEPSNIDGNPVQQKTNVNYVDKRCKKNRQKSIEHKENDS
jgi:hypothetical protein